MKANKKISVIVPIFNIVNYLPKCIETLISQTYKNIEIVLIDDGSDDGSENVCDKYASSANVKVFHMENGGVSAARNKGIEIATGEIISFVDGDDWIESDMFETLYGLMNKYEAEAIVAGTIIENEKGKELSTYATSANTEFIDSSDYISQLLLDNVQGGTVSWNKLFKKEIIKMPFKKYAIGEDIIFLYENLINANKILVANIAKYHYVQRRGSSRISSFQDKHLDSIKCANYIYYIVYKNNKKYLEEASCMKFNYYIGSISRIIYWNVETQYRDEYEKIYNELKRLFKVIKNSNKKSIQKYMSFWLLKNYKFLYKILIKIYYDNTLYKGISGRRNDFE